MNVTGLLHIGLQVPSLDVGRAFYEDFGLHTTEHPDTLALRCTGRDQDQLVLSEGPDKRLRYVAFSVPAGALPDLQRKLEQAGVPIVDGPAEGLWLRDPDGGLVNLREDEPADWTHPDRKHNYGSTVERVDQPWWPQVMDLRPAPRRLGHTLFFTPDLARAEQFYTTMLGFRVSDRIPGIGVFLNTGAGDHHVFGFLASSHRGLHHASFEVTGLDDIMIGARTMAEHGHDLHFGLGRHTLGSNLFHYIRDPWGSWVEYFSDIDKITEDWRPRDWDGPPAVWCPLLPDEFHQNHEPAERQ
ncbi:VOC family protein [Kibdelosporangium phytohabitans]|uniref:Metapyrocatechase n=1 Tax=Kibdelosporangium phytohabitans TaxID=860235 RepID=A0A0N9I3C2_9PSEU|nr:VOC family protein [Kibdelosporangium phytohabitans]ALG10392.1 metapyrocatechase [Kibdelosporangium phytohabitans]MBE1461452.1 catechol-2,3-dioxygenase [Kibdelosporangium phytohabitans]